MPERSKTGASVVDDVLGRPLILSPSSPLDSARELISRHCSHEGLRTILHHSDCFYIWKGSHYDPNPKEEIRARIYKFLDAARVTTPQGRLAPFSPNRDKVANVLDALAAETQLLGKIRPPVWLHDNVEIPAPEIVSCSNGLLHLPTRKLLPHSPNFFSLNAVDYAFEPDAGEPHGWLEFLNILWGDDQEAIDTLQEVFGLALTGNTAHQKAFLLIGPRRSGKGTIARVLAGTIGPENVAGPSLSGLAQNFGLEPLVGKRLAIIPDARLRRADQQIVAERLLSITGEDLLTIDRKNLRAWTGRLSARFLILTNELPWLMDASGALVSRFIVLTLTKSFYGREDKMLTDRLLRERPKILNWAIAGWDRLARRGCFLQPKSSNQIIEQLEDLGSPVAAFLREQCIVDEHRCVECGRLYLAWVDWCKHQGRDKPGTAQSFGKDLRATMPGLDTVQTRAEDGSRERYFQGVDLIPELEGRSWRE
jgi:putative DNA primase/helicase